jgi:transcriptional regulator with XRE-family HTH domain
MDLPKVSDIMGRTFQRPFPSVARQMTAFGDRLHMARRRRKISTVQMAERMGVSRDTLNRLEKGDPNIALGTYLRALRVLRLDQDLDLLAKDDVLGRKLQDLELETPVARRPRAQRTKSDGDS